MYTTVHFIPQDSQWVPHENSLEELFQFFGVEIVSLSAFDEPARWDAEDPTHEIWAYDRISREQAKELLRRESPLTTMLMLEDLKWNAPLVAWLAANVSPEIADGYLAWDVHIWIGPRTISDPIGEKTAAETNFDLSISGDGMPSDLEGYRQLMAKAPEIIQLNRKLAELTGSPWQNLITASY